LGIADALVIESLPGDVVLLEELDHFFILSSLLSTDLLLNRRATVDRNIKVKQQDLIQNN
jgi:hypothetical protein